MIKYRPQRGSLDDAMKEYQEFNTLGEMFEYIVSKSTEFNGSPMYSISDLSISSDNGADNRIGWKDSHYVLTNRIFDVDYIKIYGTPMAIGFCSIEE